MKNFAKKFTTYIITIMMGIGLIAPTVNPASAYATSPQTTFGAEAAILTGCAGAENGGGEGIKCVIRLVVDILSVLVGIVGVIGIVIVGIQYLTAGGNEEQTRKAKRRLFEIVIGIIAYVLVYAILRWLLPVFSPETDNTSYITNTTISLLTHVIGA